MRSASLSLVLLFLAACGDSSSDDSGGGGSSSGGAGGSSSGGSSSGGSSSGGSSSGGSGGTASGRGFPVGSPWVSFYGNIDQQASEKVASSFRIVNLDADPDNGFTKENISTMQAGGKNKVISYLNVGSCENFRSYYEKAPSGHASCKSSGALTSEYDGYPDEFWADLSNPAYQDLIVEYVAPRLAESGVDGFFLDNLEVVEHGPKDTDGPCDAKCSQGGLDLIWLLRQKFPDKLIVMQNATSDVTRKAMTHGMSFPLLLDGVSHEEVYSNGGDSGSRSEMLAWKSMGLKVAGSPFWLAVEEYAGGCDAAHKSESDDLYAQAKADGFNAYVTDESAMQAGPCYW